MHMHITTWGLRTWKGIFSLYHLASSASMRFEYFIIKIKFNNVIDNVGTTFEIMFS